MNTRAHVLVAPTCLALGLAASCAPSKVLGDAAPDPPSVHAALGEDGGCGVAGSLTEPLLVDMKDHDRAQIEVALGRGIAVFRHDCKEFRLLPQCSVAEGAYSYVGFTKKERVLKLTSADELSANLPTLGAVWGAELSADFAAGTSLDVALVTVGQRATAVPQVSREALRGDCEGATHFVKHAFVGAFAVEAGKRASARTAAEVFGVGASASASSSKFEKVMDGALTACGSATTRDADAPEGCGAILRVGLMPFVETLDAKAGDGGEPVCPSGMIRLGFICTADTTMARCRNRENDACESLCKQGEVEGCYWAAANRLPSEDALRTLRQICDERDHWESCYSTASTMIDIDRPSSLPYWKRACELGSGGHECRIWGDYYLAERGDKATQAERQEALAMVQRTCAHGESLACSMVGMAYLEPDPKRRAFEPDEQRALSMFMNACFNSHGSCFTAAQLVEGQSWCDLTGRDPKLCAQKLTSKNPVTPDRDRAITLFRRACDDYNGSCHNLFRFGLFDSAKIRKDEGDPVGYCTKPAPNDRGRVYNVYQCALAALRVTQEGKPQDARAHLERACNERAWLESRVADTCRDLHIQENVWQCNDLKVAREAADYACGKLK